MLLGEFRGLYFGQPLDLQVEVIAAVGMVMIGKPVTSLALAAKAQGMIEGAASLSFQRHQ